MLAACASPAPPALRPVASGADSSLIAVERERGAFASRAVGVPPFNISGQNANLDPLSYALADLVTTDLARSSQLTLVERTRLNDVLRELELGASGRVDPATAPRVGQLVSARRLILGALDEMPGDGRLRIAVRLADVEQGTIAQTIDASAPLVDILAAEKELVFRIFDALGITLTPAEREAISQRATSDLAALLAYGAGLRAEYQGDFRRAGAEFRRAQRLDPRFSQASQRALEVRIQSEGGSMTPLMIPGLRARDAAVGLTIDRINRPLDVMTGVARGTGGAADPGFPAGLASTIVITVTRP